MKNIIETASSNPQFSTLATAIETAGLTETLQGDGPFTVFAPTNKAFDMLPAGTVETLLKPENKAALTGVLTYHVIAGKFNAADVAKLIKASGGKAVVKTVAGGSLTFMMKGKKLMIKDEKGGVATVTIKDVNQSNGVIHVIDHVLLPNG